MLSIGWAKKHEGFRRALLWALAGGALIFFPVPSSVSWALAGENGSLVALFGRISKSVGVLYTQSSGGDLRVTCTVTVVEKVNGKSVLLTAAHCVDRDVSYTITLDGRRFFAARVWKLPEDAIDPAKNTRPYGQPKVDLALFIVDEEMGVDPVPIDETVPTDPGREIVTVGYPLGVAKISYNGIIAGTFDRPGADQDGYLLLQVFGAPGSSGSAVVDRETGRIVGVLVAGKQSAAGLPVIFATPARYRVYLVPVEKKNGK